MKVIMKTVQYILLTLMNPRIINQFILLALASVVCASGICHPATAALPDMSRIEAKRSLQKVINSARFTVRDGAFSYPEVEKQVVRINRAGFEIIGRIKSSGKPFQGFYPFEQIVGFKRIAQYGEGQWKGAGWTLPNVRPGAFQGCENLWWPSKEDSRLFRDAITVLSNPGAPAGFYSAAFKERAAAWRAAAVKPAAPGEVAKREILAVNALKEQMFVQALEHLEQGLESCPLWPQGQFNAAMISAELGDFAAAADHALCYLELVPNARNSQAVKRQLIIWEDKARTASGMQLNSN